MLIRVVWAAAFLIAVVAGIAEYLVPPAAASWLAALSWTAAGAVAVGGLAFGARRVEGSQARRAWGTLALAAACWLAGEVAYDIYLVIGQVPPVPSPADVPWVLCGAVCIAGLHRFSPFGREIRDGRTAAALDAVALYTIVGVLGAIIFYGRAEASQVGLLSKITAIAYAALFSCVAVAFGQAIFRRRALSRHPKLLALGAGVVLEAVAFVLWAPQLLAGDYVIGRYASDGCWTAGMLCLGLAGVLAARGRPFEPPGEADLRRRAVLPTAAFALSLLLLPVLLLTDADVSVRLILQGGIIVAGACFVARLRLLAHTEREADTKARAARDELDRFFALSSEMLAVIGFDGHLKRVNPAVERESGHTAGELASRPIGDFVHAEDRAKVAIAFADLLAGIQSVAFDARLRTRDGRYMPLRMSATSSPEDGVAYLVARDLTERNRVEFALRTAHASAVEASQMKSDFLANMSHEIRTPLNGVIGMTELLRDTPLTDEQSEYTDAIRASGDALLTVINDILDFSKIEAGKLDIEAGDFSLRESVEEVARMVAPAADAKGVELVAPIDDSCPEVVRGDAARFRQVLTNLVTNAVKFTPEGEVVVRTSGERRDDDRLWLRVEVSDTGVGIDPATLDRLFEPFEQGDTSTTRKYGGTGLGLAISSHLVQLMGGRIGARSAPGQGSTFWFTLPLETARGSAPDTPRPDIEGLRVLVVDDNETNRAVVEHHLRSWSADCDSAVDGPQALAVLDEAAAAGRPYELALIDFNMPGLDGGEVVRTMKGTPRLRTTRVILLTSSAERGDARDAGVDGYLTKPVRRAQLGDEIRRVMGAVAARRPAAAPPAEPAAPSAGPRVLVVEDQLVNQKVAAGLLQRRGLRVDIAPDGRRALEMHEDGGYDAIFMDCQLPEIDGYEATAEIRRREGGGLRTPIIAMTAHALTGDRERCAKAGMDDYLSKPLRPAEIDAALARALNGGEDTVPMRPPGGPDASSGAPVLDPTVLVEICAGDEGARAELAVLFVDQARAGVRDLGAAIAAGDRVRAGRIAHALKGSSATVGALRMAAACDELAHGDSAGDLLAARHLHGEIEHAFALTEGALAQTNTPKESH
jgi:PAS domain S-box-containing protein